MENFWSKVEKTDGCWNWTASLNSGGYGQLKVLKTRHNMTAHRFSYELHNGPIPDGLWVLHKCDNPRCVNPDHLFLGDAAANTADMISKGRQVIAACQKEKNGRAILDSDKVKTIRDLYGKLSLSALAKMFGVGKSQIHRIVTHQQWA